MADQGVANIEAHGGRIAKTIAALSEIVASIACVIGSFVYLPDLVELDTQGLWFNLGRFLILVVVASLWVMKLRGVRQAWWWIMGAIALLIGAGTIFASQYMQMHWTVPYHAGHTIIGDTFTPETRSYLDENPDNRGLSETELVRYFGGATTEIWVPAQIYQRRLIIVGTYLLTLICFAIVVFALVEVVYLNI